VQLRSRHSLQAKGRVKKAVVSLTDNKEKKAEGHSDQTKGTYKEKKGKPKGLCR
jgi:uncharacterized protein YjbJ (UPF0337 family)